MVVKNQPFVAQKYQESWFGMSGDRGRDNVESGEEMVSWWKRNRKIEVEFRKKEKARRVGCL